MVFLDTKEAVQLVRLADVFLIGPFLIYAGTRKEIPSSVGTGLIIIGIGTILYNGRNYIRVSREG